MQHEVLMILADPYLKVMSMSGFWLLNLHAGAIRIVPKYQIEQKDDKNTLLYFFFQSPSSDKIFEIAPKRSCASSQE